MTKNKREKVLELLNTLKEAINYICLNIDKDYKFMSEISLEAIATVEYELKKSKRSDNSIDKLIELIKKDMYNLHNKINYTSEDMNTCNRLTNNIQEAIKLAEKRLKEKINVVFMPYNAYMWNSLESIWKEAIQDDECNCYVVPIPYYKLIDRPDGKIEGIFTYEGDLLPDYVDVINYKEFDLSKVNPDIIYVHNQYDDCNNATMVHSDYFSYNLKKYTNHLVYSTYATLGAVQTWFYKPFYSLIASRKFDKVIVQSDVFKFIAQTYGVDENTIIPLGTPKFDALFSSLNNDKLNNDELADKFKNKTVFLWATNLMKIINGRHNALDQIENLFDIIKNSKDYALIYRPHPLELSYVKSKAPECFDRYMNLLEKIENYENLYLDTSPSYYESFKISDALIADTSSLILEYIATDKPILIYDEAIKREDYSDNIFDMFTNYVVGEENMTVEKFIDLVVNKKDTKRYERWNALKNTVANLDGTCGEKIYKTVKRDVMINYY